jgi:hypothetical protein
MTESESVLILRLRSGRCLCSSESAWVENPPYVLCHPRAEPALDRIGGGGPEPALAKAGDHSMRRWIPAFAGMTSGASPRGNDRVRIGVALGCHIPFATLSVLCGEQPESASCYVTPAQAGVQNHSIGNWIPAFAGMTSGAGALRERQGQNQPQSPCIGGIAPASTAGGGCATFLHLASLLLAGQGFRKYATTWILLIIRLTRVHGGCTIYQRQIRNTNIEMRSKNGGSRACARPVPAAHGQ